MKTLLSFLLAALSIGGYNSFTSSSSNLEKIIPENKITTALERGQYLVTLMDCNACHTPMMMTDQGPRPDMSRMLSGHPSDRPLPTYDSDLVKKGTLFFAPDLTSTMGPWGITFAANLTPHETGIGTWTYEHFKQAMRHGKLKGQENGRPLLPPMPWQSYSNLTDDDLQAIFQYLQSVPPIENIVHSYIPPQ